jgi:hypothetical protein
MNRVSVSLLLMCLGELVQVQHVDADDYPVLALVGLELVRVQAKVHQNHVRCVHGHDLDARCVKLQACVCEQLLEGLYEDLEGRGLDGPHLQQHVHV